jgi:hypothetical protein
MQKIVNINRFNYNKDDKSISNIAKCKQNTKKTVLIC